MSVEKVTDDIQDLSQESDEESVETIYKELKFERNRHSNTAINKCVEFWRYIYSRPDIKPVSEMVGKSFNKNKTESKLQPCEKSKNKNGIRWIMRLLELHDLGCDRMAIDLNRDCKICVQNRCLLQQKTSEDQYKKNIQKEIKNLSKWEPDPTKLSKNVY